jgi:hypothetical protein
MSTSTAALHQKIHPGKIFSFLLSLLFILLPFQRRFHGCFDSWSRKLTLPDFPLPQFFSKNIHVFITDPLILCLAIFLIIRFKVPLKEYFWAGASKYLSFLFFAALISLYFSITNHYALQYLRLLQFSTIFLFFQAICAARRRLDLKAFIPTLAWILVSVSCLQCALCVYQYFAQHALGLSFLGEINLGHFPFHNPGKHRWLFDNAAGSEFLYRASGTFTHPNILGGFVFCSVMAAFYLFMKSVGRSRKFFLIGIIFLQIFTLYIAFSRSAILALVISSLIWGGFQLKKGGFRSFRILASALLIGCVACIGLFYNQLTARGGIINYNAVTTYADSERVQYLKMAVDMIKEHPLLGIGFNNFQLYEDPVQSGYPGHIFFSKVHNIYLLIASEMGLIAGALFLLFILSVLKKAWPGKKDGEDTQEMIFLLSAFCGLLFIGLCDFYLIHTPHGRILFFGFAALLYSIKGKNEV